MTHGYGGPGAPSPDGDPDEWHRSFRAPRPLRRDSTVDDERGYPPVSGAGYPPDSSAGYPPVSGAGYPPVSGAGYPPPATYPDSAYPSAGQPPRGRPGAGGNHPRSAPPSAGQPYPTRPPAARAGTAYPDQAYPDQAYPGYEGRPASPGPQGRRGGGRSDVDRTGYDRADFDRTGYNRTGSDPTGYAQSGYEQSGYDQTGYDRSGYDQSGYDQPGSTRAGFDRTGSGRADFDRAGGYPAAPGAPARPPRQRPGYPPSGAGYQTGAFPPSSRPTGAQQTGTQQAGSRPTGSRRSGSYQTGSFAATGAGRSAPMDDLLPRTPNRARPQVTPKRRPRRATRLLYTIVTTLVLLTLVGYGASYYESHHRAAKTVTSATPVVLPKSDPILSRTSDPAPLSATEVFGHATIRSSATGGDYTVTTSQAISGCGQVGTAKIESMLSSLGCSQVVRANLTSPDGTYVITAGIANLPDEASAATARTSIKTLIEGGKEHFNAYALALASAPPVQPTTHLGWDTRGHYLFYVVIGLANGQSINPADERTPLIISDIIEKYLSTTVVGAREKVRPSATPKHT